MNIINARNPHEALPKALDILFKRGVERDSRNGKVLQLPGVTVIEYESPTERVVFWPERNASPFFHLIESLWMLAGRNDVAGVAQYAKRMATYSDDGETFNAAYGYRWRKHFGYDQIDLIIENLTKNKDDRRQVLSMWDASQPCSDLQNSKSLDLPCNLCASFSVSTSGNLDMVVFNRSNDAIWGALGSNCVHFSILMEYIAARIGIPVGKYTQVTANLHGYLETIGPLRELSHQSGIASPYELGQASVTPLLTKHEEKEFELDLFSLGNSNYRTAFFKGVVDPIEKAWKNYKLAGPMAAINFCQLIEASDWRNACTEWMLRCAKKRATKKAQDDGVNYEQ